jgi:hypothetical protein
VPPCALLCLPPPVAEAQVAMERLGRVLGHVRSLPAAAGHERPSGLANIERHLPPPEEPGVISDESKGAMSAKCQAIRTRMEPHAGHELLADIGVLVKSVEFALCFGEWYKAGDDKKANEVLAEAERRLDGISGAAWEGATGAVVRGYCSEIDGSDQPYGLEIPDEAPPDRGYPLVSRHTWRWSGGVLRDTVLVFSVRVDARQRWHCHRPALRPRTDESRGKRSERRPRPPDARRRAGGASVRPPLRGVEVGGCEFEHSVV